MRYAVIVIGQSVFVVGILNVTPDSYHDGGRFALPKAALERAREMIRGGVDIIEIGGESTGPGSKDVSVDEELSRIVPVLETLRSQVPHVRLSVDTCKAAVAKECLEHGVSMVNDVTAGRFDDAMFSVIASTNAECVLMHSKDSGPRTTIARTEYDDVMGTIRAFLEGRLESAKAAGISADRLIIDPGLGHFVSADPRYSFEIIARLREFDDLAPVFVSPSRKSFLAGADNLPSAERLPATLAATAAAVLHGARYVRTHDVAETKRACEAALAIANMGGFSS